MLLYRSEDRISIGEVLSHPWVNKTPKATPDEAQREILLKNNKIVPAEDTCEKQ